MRSPARWVVAIDNAGERGHAHSERASTAAAEVMGPRLSVVIPAFNEALYIGDCLRSLAGQDFTGSVEVIVVDNNSADQTASIARALGAIVVGEDRPGVCWARQRGTEVARGEIVVSTDADTTFDAAWLSNIDRAFTRSPSCVAVAGPCRFVGGPRWGLAYTRLVFGLVRLLYRITGKVFYVTATNIAFRKTAWTGYDTRLTQGGDELDLLRRLRAQGDVVFEVDNPTFTSARRLHRGLLYTIAVTFLFYYLLGYGLNRLLHRPVLGTYPAFRGTEPTTVPRRWLRPTPAVSILLTLIFGGLAAGLVHFE